MEKAFGQEAGAGTLSLFAFLMSAVVWPPLGLLLSVVVFFLARQAGWKTTSRICLAVAVVLFAWAAWAMLEGVGGHGVFSAGLSVPVLLD